MDSPATTRKLIDIEAPVRERLTMKALRRGVSLKRYIEDILRDDAADEVAADVSMRVTSPKILGLIGIAKLPAGASIPDDERLKYILSK